MDLQVNIYFLNLINLYNQLCYILGVNIGAAGGGYDHILIPGGQCDSPTANAVRAINVLNDRYCGTALYCLGAVPTATIAGAVELGFSFGILYTKVFNKEIMS